MAQDLIEGTTTYSPLAETRSTYEVPAWLKGWVVANPLPVALAEIDRELMACERALVPASRERLSEGLAKLLRVLNPPKNERASADLAAWWRDAEPVYTAALNDLPGDLLADAFMTVVKRSPYMPKVADIRKPVDDDLSARKVALVRLRMARQVALRQKAKEDTAVPAKDMVGIKEMMAEVYRKLGAGIPGDVDVKTGDTETERAA